MWEFTPPRGIPVPWAIIGLASVPSRGHRRLAAKSSSSTGVRSRGEATPAGGGDAGTGGGNTGLAAGGVATAGGGGTTGLTGGTAVSVDGVSFPPFPTELKCVLLPQDKITCALQARWCWNPDT